MTDPMTLHALADGELDPKEARALRDTLRADPRAAAEADAILNLKETLAKASLRHDDPEVWKGCVRRLDALDKTRRVEGFVARYAWAMCGALFLFILTGRAAMRNVQGETVQTAEIVRFSGDRTTPQAQAQAQAILKAATEGLDRTLITQSAPATGGLYNGLPAERIPLRDGDGDLVLLHVGGTLNLPDTAPMASHPELSATVANGLNCIVWHSPDGATWLLGGARPFEGLAGVATRLTSAR